jgi:signal transduction histidine kinase
VPDVQARLRRLLEANRLAVEHLDLSSVLRQIVDAAVEMVGVQYGAIGVLGSSGTLDEFIHVGMDPETVAAIGAQPVGLGLLGALIMDPEPVRLAVMKGDHRSVGFPPHHPAMKSFLGVPLEVRGQIFGHLYLADPRPDVFSGDDQQLVEALAATAGVAIAHARLFEESTRRERWTEATSRITHELLTNDEVDAVQLIAETVLSLAGADLVGVVLCEGGLRPDVELTVDRAAGQARDSVVGVVVPTDGLVGRCLETGHPQLVDEAGASSSSTLLPGSSPGPAMAVPLPAEAGVRGSLFVLRDRGSHAFTEFDLDVAASFAGHVALALDRADARLVRVRTSTLEDRDRIARDLHDHVVQRLFAAGLNIQSVCALIGPGVAADRLSTQVDEIDATIRQIRSTIFGLRATRGEPVGVRAQLLDVITAATVTLPRAPEVSFRGPLDLLVTEPLCGEVVAVVREGLTNVGRHAAAQHVEVRVAADAHSVSVEVLDDGKGLVDGVALSGLANLRTRAESIGGSFALTDRTGPGVRLHWTAPLEPVAS